MVSAFLRLALDTGARKSELRGVTWSHVNLDTGTVTIEQQLQPGMTVTFGPTKTGRSRTITIAAETVRKLRLHRQAQRELFMANRQSYVDYGLVFVIEPADQQRPHQQLRQPCRALTTCHFARVVRPLRCDGSKFTASAIPPPR